MSQAANSKDNAKEISRLRPQVSQADNRAVSDCCPSRTGFLKRRLYQTKDAPVRCQEREKVQATADKQPRPDRFHSASSLAVKMLTMLRTAETQPCPCGHTAAMHVLMDMVESVLLLRASDPEFRPGMSCCRPMISFSSGPS